MAIYVIMKTIDDRPEQGESCNEVVGIYAGAVQTKTEAQDELKGKAVEWIKDYLHFIDPTQELQYSLVICSDHNVLLAFDLLEGEQVFETIYFYRLRKRLYGDD